MAGTLPKPKASAGPDADGSAYAAMMARARALVPQLRERSARTEELRRLPPETERDLHDAGLFRIVQPKRVGGSEFDYVALVDFAEAIGLADASVAWNLANLSSHHWMLAMFDPRAQDAVWKEDADALIASSFVFPAGRAHKVDGGYVLRGRWPFSSGVDSSGWNMLAGIVSSDDEADGIEYRIFLLPKRDYKIIDTWNASGLRGTGSNDVEVDDVFVAEPMTLEVADVAGGPTPGSAVNPNALYALPVFSLFPYVLVRRRIGQRAGLPRRLHRDRAASCVDLQPRKARRPAIDQDQDRGGFRQDRRGPADHALDLHRRRCPTPGPATFRIWPPRPRSRRDGAFSVNLCTEAVSLLFAASGARGLYTSGALQRQFRDASAINSHIAFNFDAQGTNFGRVALGLPSENLTL